MIVNRKTVDPTDSSSPAVIQLETAMGAAIDVFEGAARGARAPHAASSPVKTTDDLLALRSDAYVMARRPARGAGSGARRPAPLIDLDSEYYKLLADFERRFPSGAPSLVALRAARGGRRRDLRRAT